MLAGGEGRRGLTLQKGGEGGRKTERGKFTFLFYLCREKDPFTGGKSGQ
jgi:hypothetical protein